MELFCVATALEEEREDSLSKSLCLVFHGLSLQIAGNVILLKQSQVRLSLEKAALGSLADSFSTRQEKKKHHLRLPRASKFCSWASENGRLIVRWASEISLSSLVKAAAH